jgi:hypothetical protein
VQLQVYQQLNELAMQAMAQPMFIVERTGLIKILDGGTFHNKFHCPWSQQVTILLRVTAQNRVWLRPCFSS